METRPTLAIAGATGFVGYCLRKALAPDYRIIALTRSHAIDEHVDDDGVQWKHCDLYSVAAISRAIHGADFALYLVHSMLPNSRLTQATFRDLDLLLADNFARASEQEGLRQIVYIGGLMPRTGKPSLHLLSRMEVENTLAGRTTPVTTLRAGIIVGPGGSSLRILVNLVRRLPVMILPAWTRTRTVPIAVADVIRAVKLSLGCEEMMDRQYDIGGPEVLSYKQMMEQTADVMGVRRQLWNVPFFSARLSTAWVVLFGGASWQLVAPLIESMRHDMLVDDNRLQRAIVPKATPFAQALRVSLDPQGHLMENPRHVLRRVDDAYLKAASHVRSVQRLPLPKGWSAADATREYVWWLPKFVWPFLRCEYEAPGKIGFFFRLLNIKLLELTLAPEYSSEDRQIFFITGGCLAETRHNRRGRFEFREVLGGTELIAAIHDFTPRLPWYLYNFTQALVHLWVMKGFGRHLAQLERQQAPPPMLAPKTLPAAT